MNVETGTEAAQFPEKENINEIFVAVHNQQYKVREKEGGVSQMELNQESMMAQKLKNYKQNFFFLINLFGLRAAPQGI
jgi:hypothetical protein